MRYSLIWLLVYLSLPACLAQSPATPMTLRCPPDDLALTTNVRWYFDFVAPKAWMVKTSPRQPASTATIAGQQQGRFTLTILPGNPAPQRPNTAPIRLQLSNNTGEAIALPRTDATVDGFAAVFRLHDRWISPEYMPQSYCGNSFWQDTLAAASALTMDVDGYLFRSGSYPVDCKLLLYLDKQPVESAVFTAYLTRYQFEWLLFH